MEDAVMEDAVKLQSLPGPLLLLPGRHSIRASRCANRSARPGRAGIRAGPIPARRQHPHAGPSQRLQLPQPRPRHP